MNFTIESIKLIGFTGMWLNDIQHFELTVKEAITLVLGRNGSGKSRLMEQLSPLAPAKSDFYDKGYKEIVCDNGKRYRLTCNKHGKGLKCTIVNETDNEVICENANPTVYNRFVKEIFNYDKDLHDLFTGKVRLTEMRTPDRRKWFSMLSESDLTYALSFYKKAREMNRDVSGTIKTLKRSIGELRPLVLEREEDYQALGKRIGTLQADITKIETQLRDLNYDMSISDNDIDLVEKHLDNINKEVSKMQLWLPANYEDYDVAEIERSLSFLMAKKEGLLSKLEDLDNRIAKANAINNVDIDALERNRDDQDIFVTTESTKLVMFKGLLETDLSTLNQAYSGMESYCDTLVDSMTVLTTDLPIDNCRKRLDEAKTNAGTLQQDINRLVNQEVTLTASLKHAEGVCDVTCVKCDHTFKPGVSDSEVEETRKKLGALSFVLKERRELLVHAEELVEKYSRFCVASDNIAMTARNYKVNGAVNLLFESLIERRAFIENPSSHLGLIRQFQEELGLAVHIAKAKELIAKYDHDIKLAKATQAEDTNELESMKQGVDHELNDMTKRESYLRKNLDTALSIDRTHDRAKELEVEFQRQLDEHGRISQTLMANLKAEVLNEHKAQLWDLLTTAKQRYNDMEQERQKLKFQEEQLADAEKRFEASKLLVKTMSPDEGILAKYLYQCITRITDLMSDYISRIWGYEMRIQPCEVSDGEMDYKFPFWTKDKSRPNEDVSQGSKAQKEVIDFVFVLAAYRAMGLERCPLWLDEISSGFDEGHKAELTEFVKDLVGKQHHSQVFMVSHDATTHFKLTHADIVVIDPEGITVPTKYNKNVIIK